LRSFIILAKLKSFTQAGSAAAGAWKAILDQCPERVLEDLDTVLFDVQGRGRWSAAA
jgi:hypothetical protein